MKIIEDFPVTTGKICLISALADILNFYGYGIRESELFGLCEGNLFYFGGLKGRKQEELENAYLLRELNMGGMKYEIMQMVSVLQNTLGLEVEGFELDNIADVKELVKHYIDRGIPILALVLRYYLEYSVGYMQDNFSHTVTVYGYDLEKENVYITDTFVATKPPSNYKGQLSISNFVQAFDLDKAVFEMITKERLLAIHPIKKCTFKTIPIEVLNGSLVNMATNNLQSKELQNGIFTGIQGLRKLIDELGEWQKCYSSDFFQRLLQTVHNIITNYGGPCVTSELISEYINALYSRKNISIYRELSEEFKELHRLWLIIGNMCFKASLGSLDGVCNRILERLEALLAKEEALYMKIVDRQNGLGAII